MNQYLYISRKIYIIFIVSIMLIIGGCSLTSINKKHFLIETNKEKPASTVYFIRPFTYRERGIADNPVKIALNRKKLISLGKGEYTMLRIKPIDATITTRSYTKFTNKFEPIEMTRSANMSFESGQTYFIHIRQVNEEFRGVYYLPELVGLKTAKRITEGVHAIGGARSAKIKNL